MIGKGDVGRRPESPFHAVSEVAEMNVGEVELGVPFRISSQADAFSRKSLADMIVVSFVAKLATRGDRFHFKVFGINHRPVVLIEPTRAGLVDLARALLRDRLVWTLMVVDVPPAFKAALLRAHIRGGWLGGFGFKIAVHAFV